MRRVLALHDDNVQSQGIDYTLCPKNVHYFTSEYLCQKSSTLVHTCIFIRIDEPNILIVMVQLLKQKCLPILLYALEVCNLDKRVLQSLDFTVNRFFMKLFRTSNIETVFYCQSVFGSELPSVLLVKRYDKFTEKLACTSV